tara:strand:- start:1090 stop:1704 length:615 start_codon:yes stop_codon:yes gene_type:complete
MSSKGYLIRGSGIPCGSRPPDHIPSLIGTNEEPWITRGAIDFLHENLTRDMEVLEYGTGSSTIWYAQRTKNVIAIEHDLEWVEDVRSLLPTYLQGKVKIIHIANAETGKFVGGDGKYYDKYVNYVKNTKSLFDFIAIDGRSRGPCIINSISKVKKNGFLLIDNSERDGKNGQSDYQPSIDMIPKKWEKHEFETYLGTTSIYKHV